VYLRKKKELGPGRKEVLRTTITGIRMGMLRQRGKEGGGRKLCLRRMVHFFCVGKEKEKQKKALSRPPGVEKKHTGFFISLRNEGKKPTNFP